MTVLVIKDIYISICKGTQVEFDGCLKNYKVIPFSPLVRLDNKCEFRKKHLSSFDTANII